MSEDTQENFDDPALKQTVQRSWGKEQAPAPLRQRALMAMLGSAPVIADRTAALRDSGSVLNRPLSPWAIGAIAAVFAVVLGASIYWYEQSQHPQFTTTSANGLPAKVDDEVAKKLVQRHDSFLHDKMGATTGENVAAARQKLIEELHQTVWLADLTKQGWKFEGAACVNVDSAKGAQAVFSKGDDTLSMISMPVAGNCETHGGDVEMFAKDVDKHSVFAFVANGEMYGLVGFCPDGSLKLADVQAIGNRFKSEVAGNPATQR